MVCSDHRSTSVGLIINVLILLYYILRTSCTYNIALTMSISIQCLSMLSGQKLKAFNSCKWHLTTCCVLHWGFISLLLLDLLQAVTNPALSARRKMKKNIKKKEAKKRKIADIRPSKKSKRHKMAHEHLASVDSF